MDYLPYQEHSTETIEPHYIQAEKMWQKLSLEAKTGRALPSTPLQAAYLTLLLPPSCLL